MKTKYDGMISDLRAAGYNQTADAMEELIIELVMAKGAFYSLYDQENASDLTLLTSGAMEARIVKFLNLEMKG